MATSANFVQLHNHTHYSLLDGASKIPDLVKRAKELGMPAVGITDHGNMHGAYEMWSAAVNAGIKPIIGIEAYVTPETARQDPTRVSWDTNWNPDLDPLHRRRNPDDVSGGGVITHLTMWAENDEGLVNLMKASTDANLEGRVMRYPRMDKEILAKYSKGIIASSGCPSGIIQTRLRLGQFDDALRAAGEFQDIFGRDNFYIEFMDHGLKIEKQVTDGLLDIAKKLNAPLLATNDSHYVHAEDAQAQDAMLCINSGSRLDDPDRFKFDGPGYYIKSAEEMRELFKDLPEACDNTLEIAERCNVMFDDHEDGAFMPQFDCPEGWDETSLFLKKVEEGLERRYNGKPSLEVLRQADYECGVICQMQFCGYFLVVADYINWAKAHGVMVGPGRGSAAGAMVAYAMGITELDPLEHGLIFERFLNPERVSLPDIDVDFDPDGRGRVLDYVGEKYGRDKVAQCVIYGTIKTKQALKDSARIMGYDFSVGDKITKALPPAQTGGKDIPLHDIFDPSAKRYAEAREFRELYDSDPDAKRITDEAMGIEGLIRQTGVHACATIMGSEPITNTSPLLERTDGTVTTTLEYHTCETLGLVKMDFLGLSNLTVIRDTLNNIEANGKERIDHTKIPLDDRPTYDLLSRGDTLGVFQLDSDGMRSLLKTLKPNNFNDISALIALYRPGPMDMDSHTNYAKRKNGLQKITPIHPEVAEPLKEVLDETYGLIVYQEQVQSAARILAGYSLGKADVLRRAMGKKKPEVLAKEKIPFFAGMKEHGYSEEAAQAVWDILVPFSGYAFNKAHSAAYGLISYWTAYLKTHYPVEFMAALLTSEMSNQEKLLKYISCCKDMGIDVVQPSVNASQRSFSAREGKVVFGLGGIKNVGDSAITEIMDARKDGEYVSLFDMCCRVDLRKVTKRVLEALIKGGACDCFGVSRAALLAALDTVVTRAQKKAKEKNSNQISLLAMAPQVEAKPQPGIGFDCPESGIPEMDEDQRLKNEKEALGFFLTSHPLQPFSREMRRLRLTTLEDARDLYPKAELSTAVLVVSLKEVITKSKGERMAFVGVEDLTGHAEVTFFPRAYAEARELLKSEQPLCLRATVDSQVDESRDSDEDGEETSREVKLLGQSVTLLSEACGQSDTPICVQIPAHRLGEEDILALKAILEAHPGNVEAEAMVLLDGVRCHLTLGPQFRVSPGPELDRALAAWAG